VTPIAIAARHTAITHATKSIIFMFPEVMGAV
jgi:hypothetical protein